ncbi:uncharacterized protein [Prorops nasuta]|uniref:uncharacterized protein n=1 Tax=Prorops nasuta TaxID=863751 RepID=UPI0034CDC7F1
MVSGKLVSLAIILLLNLELIAGHGMLMEPVNRGSAWRKGFKTPVNWDDDGNYCGGLSVQIGNGGKCGPCGDDWRMKSPRPNENGGTYGTGTIVQTYQEGQKVKLTVDLTANHLGFYRYAICVLRSEDQIETEECFQEYPLRLVDGSDRYRVMDKRTGLYHMEAVLPPGLTCKHCVLRWEYVAGNNWGLCQNGKGRLGCGQQETFRTCSDISIQ